MSKKFLSIVLMVAFAATAQAAWMGACNWTNGAAGDQDYHTDGNWNVFQSDFPALIGLNIAPVNVIPTPTDPNASEYDAFIDQSGDGPIVAQDLTVNVVHLGGAAWKGQSPVMDTNLTIQSGDMETLWWVVMGEQFGSGGTLNMSGGSLYVGTDLMVGAHEGGSGTLNMTGGSMDINQLFSAFYATPTQKPEQRGQINLDGGTIHVRAGLHLNDQGRMNLTGGTLTLDGDQRWGMSDLSSWNLLTAYGGTGSILSNYDSLTDVTTVTAITDAMYIDKFDTYTGDAAIQAIWEANANATIMLGFGEGHADSNAITVAYDNTLAPYVAETTKTFSPAKDFTANGMVSTDIWLYGLLGNSVEQMYVTLEDGTGATQTVDYDGDINDITTGGTGGTGAIRWTISYGSLTVDLTDIVKYTIGIGDGVAGGTGSVNFDSAIMYGPRGGSLKADLNSDSRVDMADFAIMASEWLEVAL